MSIECFPKAVIFDMDGVLADTEPLHGACFIRAFAGFGIFTTLEQYRQAVTLGGTTVRNYFLSLGGDPSDWERVKSIKDAALLRAIGDAVLLPVLLRSFPGNCAHRAILNALETACAVIGDRPLNDSKTGADREEGSEGAEITAPEPLSSNPESKEEDEKGKDEKIDLEHGQRDLR